MRAQVLFDTLKFHGASFTAPFWARVFDSVLLPIFDHVRAEVGPAVLLQPLRLPAFCVMQAASYQCVQGHRICPKNFRTSRKGEP